MKSDFDWPRFLQAGQAELASALPEWLAIFRKMEDKLPSTISMQLVVSPVLNAQASWFVGSNRHVIGVSATLMLFARRMAMIAGASFPPSENIEEFACNSFANLLLEISGFRQIAVEHPPSGTHGRDFSTTCDRLALGQVIGHELAHVWLGHLGNGHVSDVPSSSGTLRAEKVSRSHDEEVAADFWGMIAQMGWADTKGISVSHAIWAGDYFLASLGFWAKFQNDVLWPMVEELQTTKGLNAKSNRFARPPDDREHPPMALRRIAMRQNLLNALGAEADPRSEVAFAYEMASRNDAFLAGLWRGAREAFSDGVFKSLSHRPEGRTR